VTDQQITTLAIAIIFSLSMLRRSQPPSMLLYGNGRISESRETLRSEMQVLRTEIQKDILQLRLDFSERFNSIPRTGRASQTRSRPRPENHAPRTPLMAGFLWVRTAGA
jgi:hypothetical protein